MLSDELQAVFQELKREAVNQLHEFREFEVLYYSSEKQIELLNIAARHFWGELYYILLERIVLNVGTLTDPTGEDDRQCFSLHYVHTKFSKDPRYPADECSKLIDRAQDVRRHISKWRNKMVAHKDPAVVLGRLKIGEVTPAKIGDFYGFLAEYLETVSQAFELGPCPIDTVSFGGASELVGFLQRAVAFNELLENDPVFYDAAFRRSKFFDI